MLIHSKFTPIGRRGVVLNNIRPTMLCGTEACARLDEHTYSQGAALLDDGSLLYSNDQKLWLAPKEDVDAAVERLE